MNYTEQKFEDHIEESFNSSGWKSLPYSTYDRDLCLIVDDLLFFIKDSQEKDYQKLQLQYGSDTDRKLTKRISDEISKRGIVDVLRKGVKDLGSHFKLVYFEPKSGLNPEHRKLYEKNRFTVVRQLHFSTKTEESIDIVLFLNGIPLVTMELKNQLTNQTIKDSQKQYRNRDIKEPIFQFKRCIVHFGVDNDHVTMTTRVSGPKTKFLPYNKGIENPVNPNGHKSHYLWEEVLLPDSLLDILENFVHVSIEVDKEYDQKKKIVVDRKKELLIFPRYHQLSVIRGLRDTVKKEGVGHNYLIGHTTGSGKSYSIGWLSHLLTSLYQTQSDKNRMFDTIIVVTDRRILDQQLQRTIKQLEQTQGVVNPVDSTSQQLKTYLEQGKDIIITTIQKFPFISETISTLKGKTFGVIVDEVHSSQGGESAKHLKKSVSKGDDQEEEEGEDDDIDEKILKEIRSRQKQKNISFFGFTGTPKNKTLEIFGRRNDEGHFVPFHSYSMRQSIIERFTLDVLQNYTTYSRWFRLNKKEVEDKELPKSKVLTQLVSFVDSHEVTIQNKVRIILDNFRNISSKKISGRSRGMIVVRSRLHCVLFYHEIMKQMKELNVPYSCLVSFSGTVKHGGMEHTENSLNELPSGVGIPDSLKTPEYRLLIVSSKFQTGFDEPLLHSMYVDKRLSGLQCVQTLSRLNRTMSGKTDTFILDFVNKPDEVYKSYEPYYDTTVLEGETDPNRLYSLEGEIQDHHLYLPDDLDQFSQIFFGPDDQKEKLQPILNVVVDRWKQIEEVEVREQFRSQIHSFVRLYGYISQIITFEDPNLEKLFVFLQNLRLKLPKRDREDLGDLFNSIDLDSFRIQKRFEGSIDVDGGGILTPLTEGDPQGITEEEKDLLSEIIRGINDLYGSELTDEDKLDLENVQKRIENHEDLKKVFLGDNSDTNKKQFFNDVLNKIFLGYVNDRFDFYKKMEDPKVKDFITGVMYDKYRTSVSQTM
jgi:type I restriction enzyme, R subunit